MCINCSIPMPEENLLSRALDLAKANVELVLALQTHYDDIEDWRVKEIVEKFWDFPVLTPRQADWLSSILRGFQLSRPLYGDFKAIEVMFMIAGERLKNPKIRLLTKDDIFVLLSFTESKLNPGQRIIKIFRDGWAGHGQRKYLGFIHKGQVQVKTPKWWTDSIMDLLQDFSLDPAKVARASASKLGACSFCGQALTDPESKSRGYGPVCAENYELPWGQRDEATLDYERKVAELPIDKLL